MSTVQEESACQIHVLMPEILKIGKIQNQNLKKQKYGHC